jgi:hypothetical protein
MNYANIAVTENIHDNRFIGLIDNLLRAGYLEEWSKVYRFSGPR